MCAKILKKIHGNQWLCLINRLTECKQLMIINCVTEKKENKLISCLHGIKRKKEKKYVACAVIRTHTEISSGLETSSLST